MEESEQTTQRLFQTAQIYGVIDLFVERLCDVLP